MPREEQMRPKDKYTMFDRKEKTYRKGVHSELLILSLSFCSFSNTSLFPFFGGDRSVIREGNQGRRRTGRSLV